MTRIKATLACFRAFRIFNPPLFAFCHPGEAGWGAGRTRLSEAALRLSRMCMWSNLCIPRRRQPSSSLATIFPFSVSNRLPILRTFYIILQPIIIVLASFLAQAMRISIPTRSCILVQPWLAIGFGPESLTQCLTMPPHHPSSTSTKRVRSEKSSIV